MIQRFATLVPAMFILSLLLISISGCAFFEGFDGGSSNSTMSKQELIDWYAKFENHPPALIYGGSDAEWHYFRCHTMDRYTGIRVPRSELHLPVEFSDMDATKTDYRVDPIHNFQKID